MSASFAFNQSTTPEPITLTTVSNQQLLGASPNFFSSASTAAGAIGQQQHAGVASRIAADLVQLNSGRLSAAPTLGFQTSRAAATAGTSASFQLSSSAAQQQQAIAGSRLASAQQQLTGVASAVGTGGFLSEIESTILRATVPVESSETEEITVNGERGQWLNRQEVVNWKGVIPITEYVINQDANPEIITKRTQQQLEYIQELAIRYLRPPTPPAPGEIIIKQDINSLVPPAPPLIIRQQPARPDTPEPLVIREAPPQPPAQVGKKVITISGKRVPPPPRKVIIERLAQLPSKPQSVLIERWLPYAQVKRRVIYQGAAQADAVLVKPRNVIIQWEAPQVVVRKEVKYLGVIRANPVEYVQKYGATLKVARDLPQYVLDIKTPEGLVLAADYQYNSLYELEGDLQALKLVDLDREGLSEYRAYLAKLGITYSSGRLSVTGNNGQAASFAATASNLAALTASRQSALAAASVSANVASVSTAALASSRINLGSALTTTNTASTAINRAGAASASAIQQAFAEVDSDSNGKITVSEGEKILLRLNSRLGRNYGEDDVKAFFAALDRNNDGSIDLEEFKLAFGSLL